jgi:hypothetical protein
MKRRRKRRLRRKRRRRKRTVSGVHNTSVVYSHNTCVYYCLRTINEYWLISSIDFPAKKKKLGKNPDVDTSFLPDRDREVSLMYIQPVTLILSKSNLPYIEGEYLYLLMIPISCCQGSLKSRFTPSSLVTALF